MPYKRVRAWPGFGDHVGWVEGQAAGRKGVGGALKDWLYLRGGGREHVGVF